MEKKIEKIFSNLEDWRKLPKYQLERRLDIFFSIYLKEIVEKFYSEILKKDKIELYDFIIPEFPLKKDGEKVFSSTNVDYVMFCEDKPKCIFIELKTDINSVDDEQIIYLTKAKEKKWKKILEEVNEIEQHTGSSKKYADLVNYINKNRENMGNFSTINDIDVIYIHPIASEIIKDDAIFKSINFDFISNRILSEKNDLISKSLKDILEKIFIESIEKNHKKKKKYKTEY